MNRFWNNLIRPIIERVNANYIVEIGSDTGLNTKNILEYCVDHDGHMTAIDPFPKFDIDEFKSQYGDKFEIYRELSLERLPLLKDYDAILIDGDHNWYTVYNELKTIEETFKNKKFPIIFFHDITWPYARRDLYYNPENIPEAYRQPYKKLGMYPGQTDLKNEGGLNTHLYNSIYENNPHNGVLTAVEDFLDESDLDFSFKIIDTFYGLGILYPANDETEEIVKNCIKKADLLNSVEEERVKLKIAYSESEGQNKLLETKLGHLEGQLIQQKETYITAMEEKDWNIEELNSQVNNLKAQTNNLKASFYERDYLQNVGRPITQQLISKFPSLYILLKRHSKGIKDTLINIKAYKSIKKNNLFNIGYYLKNNKDIRLSGVDPLLHYMYHGFKEGRTPNPSFDGNYYLKMYEDVKNSNLNPLVHYSLYGKKEGRKPCKNPEIKQYSHDQIDDILNSLHPDKKISVIIPIYNAFEDTKKCIESVLEYTKIPYEMILIDDCSTDKRIAILLDEMEEIPYVHVIRNQENKGFVKNINTGILNSKEDVVLLNSDTIVTPKWLQKLVVAAYSDKKIGTVTPLSNAAGAFSVPEIGKENKIPESLTINQVANLVEKVSDNANLKIPTGNGFCMFIKRRIINDVGLFDEENFGQGYGEENDFCMRVLEKSWTNIMDDSTYIYHNGSASFSSKKEGLLKEHRAVLDKKHPVYTKRVREFVSSAEYEEIRNKIKTTLTESDIVRPNKKRILYVLHSGGGGTPHTNEDLMGNIQNELDCYVLLSSAKTVTLQKYVHNKFENIHSWTIKSKWSANDFHNPEFRDIYFNVLIGLKIDIVHIRHLIKHTFDLPDVARSLGLPIITSFHDFYFICPSYNLLDENNVYCAGICTEGREQCNVSMDILKDLPPLKTFVKRWRNEVAKVFSKSSAFVTTSEGQWKLIF
ncbi:MAG: glycosyltransferase [Methanobacterium paludis]|nr:glycosyltransferase [Methanobacterium paludis]